MKLLPTGEDDVVLRTRDMGVGDLGLTGWRIFALSRLDGADGVERHIFGFCPETDLYQISSEILEETPDWIRTRSRRYYKLGPPGRRWQLQEFGEFARFLTIWRVDTAEIETVVASLEANA